MTREPLMETPGVDRASSVVIAAHNASDTLGAQLDALALQQGDVELEVIVVANRCSDGTVDLVEQYRRSERFPHELRVIRADDLAGASYARNRGVELTCTSQILVCDADDIVWPNWATELCRSLRYAELVRGIEVDWNPNDNPDPTTIEPHINTTDYVDVECPVYLGFLPTVAGSNHGFRRSMWDEVGGYDETIATGEDADFAWRVQLAGGTLLCNNRAVVYYRDRQTMRGLYARERAYGYSDVQLFLKFRDRGMPRRKRGFRRRPDYRYLHQVATMYRLLTPLGRRTWVAHLGKNVGRIEGSLRHRVMYL